MPRENAYDKGMRLLTEHRLTITEVTVDSITAMVRGSGEFYRCGWTPDGWWCECPVLTGHCSHLHALRAVTIAEPSRRRESSR